MDVHFSAFEFQGLARELILYGSLWIHLDHLEGVREMMISQGQDISHISGRIENMYVMMGTAYWCIMSCIQPFGLRLGISSDHTRLIVEEDMD